MKKRPETLPARDAEFPPKLKQNSRSVRAKRWISGGTAQHFPAIRQTRIAGSAVTSVCNF